MEFKVEDAIHWFTKVNDKIQENKEYLTSLRLKLENIVTIKHFLFYFG